MSQHHCMTLPNPEGWVADLPPSCGRRLAGPTGACSDPCLRPCPAPAPSPAHCGASGPGARCPSHAAPAGPALCPLPPVCPEGKQATVSAMFDHSLQEHAYTFWSHDLGLMQFGLACTTFFVKLLMMQGGACLACLCSD